MSVLAGQVSSSSSSAGLRHRPVMPANDPRWRQLWRRLARTVSDTESDNGGWWVLDRISLLVMPCDLCIFSIQRKTNYQERQIKYLHGFEPGTE